MTEPSKGLEPSPVPMWSWRVFVASCGLGLVVALSVAAQTYLSMLGHGHSFPRMLAWQLVTWAFWSGVAPLVIHRGAEFVAQRPRRFSDIARLAGLGALLLVVHSLISAQLTTWIQPFVPVESYDLFDAWFRQMPARFATDVLTFGLLVSVGGALWTYRRAQELEVRESRLETELARAQLHALRLEIEPHFLFNTLNTITALVRLRDNNRAVDMLVGLGEFMRSNLERPHEQFVTLDTEIAWAKRYIALQQARFGERLEVEYQIADDCLEQPVPTLLLQPIVENAFRHGLSRQNHRCHLRLCAGRQVDAVNITVADDGAGLPPDFDVERQPGTGLRNVRSRLAQLYGHDARFEISGGGKTGTIVTVRLPIGGPALDVRATA